MTPESFDSQIHPIFKQFSSFVDRNILKYYKMSQFETSKQNTIKTTRTVISDFLKSINLFDQTWSALTDYDKRHIKKIYTGKMSAFSRNLKIENRDIGVLRSLQCDIRKYIRESPDEFAQRLWNFRFNQLSIRINKREAEINGT